MCDDVFFEPFQILSFKNVILSYRFWIRRARQDLSGFGCREEVAGSHCRSNQASEDGSVGRNSVKKI